MEKLKSLANILFTPLFPYPYSAKETTGQTPQHFYKCLFLKTGVLSGLALGVASVFLTLQQLLLVLTGLCLGLVYLVSLFLQAQQAQLTHRLVFLASRYGFLILALGLCVVAFGENWWIVFVGCFGYIFVLVIEVIGFSAQAIRYTLFRDKGST